MDSTWVDMSGSELELRTLSARQYLSARLEADKLIEEFGNDSVTQAVLMGAALLARGLFNEEGQMYDSALEVLNSMTAGEIVDLSGYIDIEQETRKRLLEVNNETEVSGKQDDVFGEETDKDSSFEGLPDYQQSKNQKRTVISSAYSSVSSEHIGVSNNVCKSPQGAMRHVSDFFQRDSRRYDGIISSY